MYCSRNKTNFMASLHWIFFKFFQNEDGKLTMEEFREGSKRDPWIVQALAIDLPQEDLSQGDD